MSDKKDIQRWVDPAMYAAEPVDMSGPQVFLIEATPDPLGSIAAAAALYEGKVRRSKAEVTHAERQKYLAEMQKTKIKAPLEFVQFHFLLEGVTRGFTHQLVRQRTATFVQESTRFAVKEDVPVGLPPSLAGTTDEHLFTGGDDYARLSQEQKWRVDWDHALHETQAVYNKLVRTGMPAEDARGLLPTNLLTRVHYSTDLRALLDHAGNRLCTQAQFEWRMVFAKMAEAIRHYKPAHRPSVRGVMQSDEHVIVDHYYEQDRWQWEAIAGLLKPICYATGKCEFTASFDRACSIRERVQENHSLGRPSSEWHIVGPTMTAPGGSHYDSVQPIEPREWLADPGAAR